MKSEIQQHITQEDLLRYVEDSCSRTEMRAIDRHLATCPMCSDAVEGLMLLSEPMIIIDNLNKKIDEKVAEISAEKPVGNPIKLPTEQAVLQIEQPILQVIKRPFWQQRWAAAAAILVLVSSSIWIYNNTQKHKNQAVASAEIAMLPNVADSLPPQYAAAETAKTSNNSAELSSKKEGLNKGESAQLNEPKKGTFKEDFDKKADNDFDGKEPQKQPTPSAEVAVADQSVAAEKVVSAAPTRASAPVVYAPQDDRTRDYAGASAQNSVPRSTSMPAKAKDATVTAIEESKYKAKETEAAQKMQEAVVTGKAKAKKNEYSSMPKPSAPASKPSTPTISADSTASIPPPYQQLLTKF